MLQRLFSQEARSPRPDLRSANEFPPIFSNVDTVAKIMENITDLLTLHNFVRAFPVAGLVMAQWPSSILSHHISDDLIPHIVTSTITVYSNQRQRLIALFLNGFTDESWPPIKIPRLFHGSQVLERLIKSIDNGNRPHTPHLPNDIQVFENLLKWTTNRSCLEIPRLAKCTKVLERFLLINDAVETYGNFLELIGPREAKEALWHLEIYSALFLTGCRADKSSPVYLTNQVRYLHQLDQEVFCTLHSIFTTYCQRLNSPSLHDTQHRLYETLKLGHGLTKSQSKVGLFPCENREFWERYLAFQLSLALPEVLRIFHYQWSRYLRGPVPDVSYDATEVRLPREIFQQRLEEWRLLWGPVAYQELDENEEAELLSEGITVPTRNQVKILTLIGLFVQILSWVIGAVLIYYLVRY